MEEANPMFREAKLPESPRLPMEFLSRSWSLPALQLSKALSHSLPSIVSKTVASCTPTPPILEEEDNAPEGGPTLQTLKQRLISGGHSFSFASSTTSQLVLERIMSQSEVSPMTSGRPSCSEPITCLNDHQIDSPDLSLSLSLSPPHEFDYNNSKFLYSSSTPQPLLPPTTRVSGKNGGGSTPGGAGSKTVGRWLKDRREKKKEETRVQNAQLHASISVAAVAAAIAATTAATAAASSSSSEKDEQAAMTDMAMASAATLVAARCVEAAEAMGADHEHLASVISSAVNVQSHGDIMTLTAAAATALRGAATLKARTMKEVCNIAAVLPVEKGCGMKGDCGGNNYMNGSSCYGEGGVVGEDFLGLCNEQLLARGSELLKRTRQGDLHWKLVSVYINKEDEVVLKMKSLRIGGTLTKKKKKALLDVCKDTRPWPERYMMEGGEDRRYFGLKTVSHRVIEFECKNQKEYHLWTQGVSRLLSIATERRENKF